MSGSIIDMLLKAIGGFGITEYQKNQLTAEALKDGELLSIIPCSIKESGMWGYQAGQVAITKTTVVFGQTGKTSQIGFKLSLSWFQRFPLSTFSNYSKSNKDYLFGAYTVYTISYSHNKKNYELIFTQENRDKFEKYISAARQ